MSGILGFLSGAPQAANNAGGYYQNAANNLVSAYGSPAAQTFSGEEMAALRPQFAQQNEQQLATEAATGLAGSGAGRASLGDVTAQQSAALAQNVGPLYSQALGQYGDIMQEMPGAQEQAYQGAIQDFYDALQTGASAAGAASGFGNPFGSSGGSSSSFPGTAVNVGGTYYTGSGGYGQVGYG